MGGIFLTRQAMKPIEKSFDRLQQFTADASHELRSPLMAIKASAQVALRYSEGMRPSDAEEFGAIAQSVEHMSRLTEDLLMLARMNEKLTIVGESIDLTELLQHLVKKFQPQALAKELTLVYQSSESLMIKGNSDQILRLFTNLIENALHYTPSGGKITISTSVAGQWIDVRVKDTGIGIIDYDKETIFKSHFSTKGKLGSGFGLIISNMN
jgi:signal transduction histidine kinase